MSTVKFDKVPTHAESTTVEGIGRDVIEQAWQSYEAKPEYKEFNKHDLIESMLPHQQDDQQK
ncbi:MAG: hypothetical protein E6Q25_02755 [Acinetobacter sp.]|nr:MAG: hypothetical protein E6Q25_02755 [Acinetobacter sp.]